MSRFSSGRDSLEPEMPRSTYSPKTSHPRRDAYSRSSANCISGLCPLHVETLAYRATRMSIPPRVARGQLSLSILRNSAESPVRRQPMLLQTTDPNPSHFSHRSRIFEGDGTVEGPLLSCWPEKRFERSEILGLGCAVELDRSEEHTSELQSLRHLVCRLL